MFVLLSITLLSFLALFGMLIVLLRQAKAEGMARGEGRSRGFAGRRRRTTGTQPDGTPPPSLETEIDLSLSSLVPEKQPDFRFMVREGGRALRKDSTRSEARPPAVFEEVHERDFATQPNAAKRA